MKLKRTLLIILAVIIGIFLLTKLYYLNKYKTEPSYLLFYFKEPINIKVKDVKNPITYDILSFKNVFPGFKKSDTEEAFVKYDKKKNVVAYYTIDVYPLFINSLNEEAFKLVLPYEERNGYTTEKSTFDYLKKRNVYNDIDLIKYAKRNYPFRNSLFTPIATMRNNFLIYSFTNISLSNLKSITFIDGDLQGYVAEYMGAYNKDIHLIYKDKQYCINLFGDEIANDTFVKSLLETIKFNDDNKEK